jgi:GTP-binding protein
MPGRCFSLRTGIMNFTAAIVGRPNVGKSTLFNRLVGKRLALVDDQPGVTRDRREGEARLGDQTDAAIRAADVVLILIDARAGLMPLDQTFAEIVRKSGKPTILLSNKSESRDARAGVVEGYELGLGTPIPFSAEHGEGMGDLYDALREALPEATAEPSEDEHQATEGGPIRIAVVGRPNAGKSTLINRLLGEERLLTGPEAGITRDSIAVTVTWEDKTFQVHDTAGIRKRANVQEKLEKLSVADALRAIKFAEVVVLLLDSMHPFEEQDLRLADLVVREGRALVIAMNKWDLIEKKGGAGHLREEVDHWLPQVKGVPIVATSGLSGENLDRLMQAVVDAHAMWNKRVSTAALNRWLGEATSAHPPPAVSGRRIKINYITQAKARPPSFVLFTTRADAIPEAYRRYLVNGLREAFELPGTPVRLMLREKENPFDDRDAR